MTEKDKEFLEKLKALMESRDLSVELKPDSPSYMVLRGTYGEQIHKTFRMSRQGVRWRFAHIFNGAYVAAFEVIMMIEQNFGVHLRDHAIRISKERYALRNETVQRSLRSAEEVLPQTGAGDSGPAGEDK